MDKTIKKRRLIGETKIDTKLRTQALKLDDMVRFNGNVCCQITPVVCSVENMEIKLGRTFVRAARTNRAGGRSEEALSPSGGVRSGASFKNVLGSG